MELCEIQRRSGLYFIFEHPSSVSSWSTSTVQRMLRHAGVKDYEGDMRQFGTQQTANGEPLSIKKRTNYMTNSRHVGKELSQRCEGPRRRAELTGGSRADRSEIYPGELREATLIGLAQQLK